MEKAIGAMLFGIIFILVLVGHRLDSMDDKLEILAGTALLHEGQGHLLGQGTCAISAETLADEQLTNKIVAACRHNLLENQ